MQMGIPGKFGDASVRAAYQKTIAVCRKHGKWSGMGGLYDQGIMADHISAGIQFVLAGTDMSFMMSSASQKVKQLRQIRRQIGLCVPETLSALAGSPTTFSVLSVGINKFSFKPLMCTETLVRN